MDTFWSSIESECIRKNPINLNQNKMNILSEIKERASAPTPPFFQQIKKIGLIIAAVGTAVITAPGSLPAFLLTYAGYAITAGTVLVSIAQLTVDEGRLEEKLKASVK